ncbi:MAG: Crp/Fnr family transcriptional regulator [Prevotella sp.]|nr:Crp/Fnr family transcriptional regulator [Prevotella sp.]
MNIYDRLSHLPIFQGMTTDDLTTLAGQTKFIFQRFSAGETVIREGDPCGQLCSLMRGTLIVQTDADDHGYTFSELIEAPATLQLERAFGFGQRYTSTFVAATDCNIMVLDKSEILHLTDDFLAVRLNLLNILSTQHQRLLRRQWHPQPTEISERITKFIESHSLKPSGKKILKIKMKRLASELNTNHIYISNALNEMQEKGLVVLRRGIIEVPDLRLLLP